jgi:hypothetical protein
MQMVKNKTLNIFENYLLYGYYPFLWKIKIASSKLEWILNCLEVDIRTCFHSSIDALLLKNYWP